MRSCKLGRRFLLGLLIWSLTALPGPAAQPPATLNLKEALRLAWKANPTLKVSRLDELIAGEEVIRARSGFLPQVKAQLNQTIFDNPREIMFIFSFFL